MLNDILIIVMFGLGAGAVTAGGYFAVVTRFAQYTNTADKIRLYESLIMAGAILGNILFVFSPGLKIWGGMMAVFGLAAGIFTGCFLMSLAETVKGVPVFIRRTGLTTGLCILIIVLAAGKSLGSFFYFCFYK